MDEHELVVAVLRHVPSQALLRCESVSSAMRAGVACETVWHARWLAEEATEEADYLEEKWLELLPTWRERVCVLMAARQVDSEQDKSGCLLIDVLGRGGWSELISLVYQSYRNTSLSLLQHVQNTAGHTRTMRLRPGAAKALAELVSEDAVRFLNACMHAALHRAHADHDGSLWSRLQLRKSLKPGASKKLKYSFYPVVGRRDVLFVTASAHLPRTSRPLVRLTARFVLGSARFGRLLAQRRPRLVVYRRFQRLGIPERPRRAALTSDGSC